MPDLLSGTTCSPHACKWGWHAVLHYACSYLTYILTIWNTEELSIQKVSKMWCIQSERMNHSYSFSFLFVKGLCRLWITLLRSLMVKTIGLDNNVHGSLKEFMATSLIGNSVVNEKLCKQCNIKERSHYFLLKIKRCWSCPLEKELNCWLFSFKKISDSGSTQRTRIICTSSKEKLKCHIFQSDQITSKCTRSAWVSVQRLSQFLIMTSTHKNKVTMNLRGQIWKVHIQSQKVANKTTTYNN